jgi:WhiB family transcriptional regulator, redox-sensing transcriptional regulator
MGDLYSPTWLPDAACVGLDSDMFFASENGKYTSPKTKDALKVCRDCPVVRKCLEWALETGDGFAVLGGMTPNQRQRYRRELEYTKIVRKSD